ncbi:hypothetical protein BH23CHL5_BH23CHL5_15820 [soil metagenome]
MAHIDGPLRLMAGAGTGKTFTLTERIVSLIGNGHATPEQILALTFTNKAVDELRSRVDPAVRAVPRANSRVDIDTYHAFGSRIAGEFGLAIGLPPEPLLLTSAESWILLWRAVDEIDFQHIELTNLRSGGFGGSPLHNIIKLGSRLSDELRSLDDLTAFLDGLGSNDDTANTLRDYARGLAVYQQKKRDLGAIDFGDQIALACELLERPDVSSELAERYRYVLVDEFQDTNFSQSMMVQRLVDPESRNICVVGDPNQAIYAFRGAAPNTMQRFATDVFPGTVTLPLRTNYRSTTAILMVANSLWANDPAGEHQDLVSAINEFGDAPIFVEAETFVDEAAWICHEIERLVAEEDFSYRQIAVIVRKNTRKRDLWKALRAAGIPAEASGSESLFDTPEVRELISYLRTVSDHRNDTSFATVLCSDRWGFDEAFLYDLARQRRKDELLQDAARRIVAEPGAPERLAECLIALDTLTQQSFAGIEPVLDGIIALRHGGYTSLEAANIDRVASLIRDFASSRVDRPSLEDLAIYLDLLITAGGDEEAATDVGSADADTVKVVTAHAAKGLEWKVVFVATANKQDFSQGSNRKHGDLPDALAQPSPGRPERFDFTADEDGLKQFDAALKAFRKEQGEREELRVLYVALTRAQERLYITWAAEHPSRARPVKRLPALDTALIHCVQVSAPSVEYQETVSTIGEFARKHLDAIRAVAGSSECANDTNEWEALRSNWVAFGGTAQVVDRAMAQFANEKQQLTEQIALLNRVDQVEPVFAHDEQRGDLVVSYTQLDTWERCPHRYYLRHHVRLPGAPRRSATQFGNAMHHAVASEAEQRRLGIATSRESLNRSIDLEMGIEQAPAGASPGDTTNGMVDPVDAYMKSVDAIAEPILVEEAFTLRLENALVKGVIDRVHRLPDGSTEVVDYKTDRSLRSREAVVGGLQLPIYVMACQEIFREITPPPQRAAMFFLRHDVRHEHDYSAGELAGVRERIELMAEEMKAVSPDRHNASITECTYCEYRSVCRFSVVTSA